MENKIRILHVNGRLHTGGIENFLYTIAKFNIRTKYDLAFLSYVGEKGFTGRRIEELGYPVYSLNLDKKLYDIRIIPKIVKVIKSYNPHIVHFYQGSIIGRISAKISGVPIIVRNEMDMNYNRHGLRLKISTFAKNTLDPITDKLIACSYAVKNFWWKGDTTKCEVLYIPFDNYNFKTFEINGNEFKNGKYPVIGTVSRINKEKGHQYLIHAMADILKTYPDARLKIVGSGPLLDDLKNLVSSLKLIDSVEFTGFVEDIHSELSSLDIFILPSLSEGFPVSILEAMAAGLPVAASNVGGIPEMIEDGRTGILLRPGDPKSISMAINYLLSNIKRLKEFGEYGKQKVLREYTPEGYFKKLDLMYQSLLRNKRYNMDGFYK